MPRPLRNLPNTNDTENSGRCACRETEKNNREHKCSKGQNCEQNNAR